MGVSPIKLSPLSTGEQLPSGKRVIHLIIGWCTPCETFLLSNAGNSGDKDKDETTSEVMRANISSNPRPRSLVSAMQLWLWKTQKKHQEPVDLHVLPVGFLGSGGPQPEEMGDSIFRTGRTSLRKAMEGIAPREVNIVPHSPLANQRFRSSASSTALGLGILLPEGVAGIATLSGPRSHYSVLYLEAAIRTLNKRTLDRIARRAQWWTLAWATGQDYLCREWRMRNPSPGSELLLMGAVMGWERRRGEDELMEGDDIAQQRLRWESESERFEEEERSSDDDKKSRAEVSPLSQMRHPPGDLADVSPLSLYERRSEYVSDEDETSRRT
jgi:hypothetical protein